MQSSRNTTRLCAAIIPALNEESSIGRVVADAKKYAVPIVVDDGSNDATASKAAEEGAIVCRHNRNLGYDAALETGILKAIELGFKYAVTLDADGQHQPSSIKSFTTLLDASVDVVVGKRPRTQRFAERVFALVANVFWGIEDPLCGMKGYKLEQIRQRGRFQSYDSIGTEFAIRAARSGYVVVNQPIENQPRPGKPRFGTGIRANAIIINALLKGTWKAKSFEQNQSHEAAKSSDPIKIE